MKESLEAKKKELTNEETIKNQLETTFVSSEESDSGKNQTQNF